jgi:hypothetical protein
MSWATPKTQGYTMKGSSELEIKRKIEDAVGRGHKLMNQGETQVTPEKKLFWAKMSL